MIDVNEPHPRCDRTDCLQHGTLTEPWIRKTIPPMPADFWRRISEREFRAIFETQDYTLLVDESALQAIRTRCKALSIDLKV